MATSEQLEREAEQTMVQIADTLAELRDHLTPSRILDDALDYARDGGGQLTRNLVRNIGRQVVQNPIPAALVGVGIIWLTMAGKLPRSSRVAKPATSNDLTSAATDRATRAVAGVKRGISPMPTEITDDASDFAESAGQTIHDANDTAYGQTTSGARDTTRTIRQSAATAVENALNSGRTLAAYLRNEPLVLAGLGLALGALIGASLPHGEKEDELMGQSSEALKEGAVKAAKESAVGSSETR
jgi:hypothetical protein